MLLLSGARLAAALRLAGVPVSRAISSAMPSTGRFGASFASGSGRSGLTGPAAASRVSAELPFMSSSVSEVIEETSVAGPSTLTWDGPLRSAWASPEERLDGLSTQLAAANRNAAPQMLATMPPLPLVASISRSSSGKVMISALPNGRAVPGMRRVVVRFCCGRNWA